MPTIERGLPLVQHVITTLKARHAKRGGDPIVGASRAALDALESRLMVELPPTLRAFLAVDFHFNLFGKAFHGRGRFGQNPQSPRPRLTSVRKLAEAKTELGWTDSRIKTKLVRLPNRPRRAWNALYLGEARRDGELVILGIEHEDTLVRFAPRYTAFDLYLAEQAGLIELTDAQRLEDLESHLALNHELASGDDQDDGDSDY
ncbi:MAG: SMI1/KNR4 family protein [Polyangiaceae bacterium]